MPEWLALIIELFRSGQGFPLLLVLVAALLSLYLLGLLAALIVPVWRRNRSPHQ